MKNLFDGLRVADFTMNTAGPYATAMLADFGAEVIKIEKPKLGDDQRNYSPQLDGTAVGFLWCNRGKKSIVLDMDDPEGVEIAKKLIETADVVAESFKPGTMAKFGLGYEEVKKINPKIIYCSVSAYGQTGPMRSKPGYDMIAQALSGVMDLTGEPSGPPSRIGIVVADLSAGCHAFGAIASALYHRERTGQGQYIDIALLDSIVAFNSYVEHNAAGNFVRRTGNNTPTLAPFGVFRGKDSYAIICAPNVKLWAGLCKVMGREDLTTDPQFNTVVARVKNYPQLIELIENWLKTFDSIDVPLAMMDKAGVPCAKINSTRDVLSDEQLIAREMIVDFGTPKGTPLKAKGSPLKFSEVKADIKLPPALGQNQDEVLKALGYSNEAIADIKTRWSVAR